MAGEGGYFRCNHLVPVSRVRDRAIFDDFLRKASNADAERVIGERTEAVGSLMIHEATHFGTLAKVPPATPISANRRRDSAPPSP